MTITKTLLLTVAVAASARTARAEDETKTLPLMVDLAPRPAAPNPAPTVAFAWPTELGTVPTKMESADAAKRQIRLDLKHWKVSPGGNGVVLVLDNLRALEIHDLSKPIDVNDFFRGLDSELDIGWHFMAAFAVTPDGISVQGSLAVVHFIFSKDDGGRRGPSEFKDKPQMVVNRVALGHFAAREQHPGWVFRDAKRVVLDLLLWYPPGMAPRDDCYSKIEAVAHAGTVAGEGIFDTEKARSSMDTAFVKVPGLYAIKNFQAPRFDDGGLLYINILGCPKYKDIDTGVSPPDNSYWNGAGMALWRR
jgi:hypothetical protein